jgi:hypothetical protein
MCTGWDPEQPQVAEVMETLLATQLGTEGLYVGDLLAGEQSLQRRLGFLRRGHTRLFSPFDPDLGDEYRSLLPDILCALE